MSGTRPEFQPKRLVAASLFAVAIMVGSFLIMAVGNAVIVVAFALIICWLGYVYAVMGYRPKTSRSALLPAMVLGIVTIFPREHGQPLPLAHRVRRDPALHGYQHRDPRTPKQPEYLHQ